MSITPHIVVQGADRAAAFYRDAFGAEELDRIPVPGGRLMSVQLRIGGGLLHLADEFPEMGVLAPPSIGGTAVVLALDVTDAEAAFAQAITAGAEVRQPLADTFWGERHGQVEDPFGHRWNVSQHLRDVPHDEVVAAAASAFAAGPAELMRYRRFGTSGLRVSELFLGAMTFGEQGGVGAPAPECRRILDAYADAGGNVIDTAINYRGGASEEILGELLAGRRDRFVLATKYTVSRDRDDPNAAGNHRKNMRLSLDTSLRRLRTDYLDIYWVHMWDRDTPVEETMRALDDEVRAGRILYVGISDTPAWLIARANTLAQWHDWTPFAGLQVPYSLLQRDIERELLPMAETLGMTVAVWSPLEGGILSGKFTRPNGPEHGTRVDPASITEHQRNVATTLQAVADDVGATPSQVAIAWAQRRSPAIHPIVGARRLDQLLDNLGATDVDLPDDAAARLDAAAEPDLGFPATFIRETSPWVFGAASLAQAGRTA